MGFVLRRQFCGQTNPIAGINAAHKEMKLQSTRMEELRGGKLLDIGVPDHIILSSDGFYGFADEGMI